MRKPSLSKISALLFIFILLLRRTSSLADASGPTVGRNFRLQVADSDMVVVTFTEDLPVTSADTYFDIVADDGFYGEKVFDG